MLQSSGSSDGTGCSRMEENWLIQGWSMGNIKVDVSVWEHNKCLSYNKSIAACHQLNNVREQKHTLYTPLIVPNMEIQS